MLWHAKTDSAKEWTDIMNDIFWGLIRLKDFRPKYWKHTEASDRVSLGFEDSASRCVTLAGGETSLLHPPNLDTADCSVSMAETQTQTLNTNEQISCNNAHKIKTQMGTSTPWTFKSLQPQHPLHSYRQRVFGRSWPLCQWHQWCILGWAAACAHTPVDQAGTALALFCCA